MRNRLAIAAALCAAGFRPAGASSEALHASVAPSVAPQGPVQIATVASDAAAFDGPLPSLSWSWGRDTSAMLGSAWQGDQLLPSIGLRRRLLSQGSSGVEVGIGFSFRSVGREDTGSELATTVTLARTFGGVSFSANAGLGKGVGARSDVDFELASLLAARITRWAKIGIEARVHGELVDDLETPEDRGRSLGVMMAPSLSMSAGPWALDILAGWERPRGSTPERPVGLVAAAYVF